MSAWCGALCHGILLHWTIHTRPTAPPTKHGVRDYRNPLASFYRERIFLAPLPRFAITAHPLSNVQPHASGSRSGSGSESLRIPHLLAFPVSFRHRLYATSYHHFILGSLSLLGSARPFYRQLSSPHRQMLLSDATNTQQIPPLPTLSDFSPEQAPCGVPAAPLKADLQGTSALRFITPVPLNADSYCIHIVSSSPYCNLCTPLRCSGALPEISPSLLLFSRGQLPNLRMSSVHLLLIPSGSYCYIPSALPTMPRRS
jgi:hypothetical protein